jgi:hypothetical protein
MVHNKYSLLLRMTIGCFLWIASSAAAAGEALSQTEREWQHVREVLFTALEDSTYDGERITRWDEQPVLILIGANDDDRAFVERTLRRLNLLLGRFPIRIEEVDKGNVNVGILFASSQLMPAMAARHGMQADIAKRGAGYTELSVKPDHSAQISVSLIKDELVGDERQATLIHELYHALGPSGHSQGFPESVVFQNDEATSTALGLASIDAKVLALLYGYLSPGDTEQDAREIFDRHWADLDRVVAAQ